MSKLERLERKLHQIRDDACTSLTRKGYESKTTPDILDAVRFLKSSQRPDHSWDLESLFMFRTRELILPRLACTSYAAVMIGRAEGKTDPIIEKAFEWIKNNYEILLSGKDILSLAYCAYYLTRTVQTKVKEDEDLWRIAGELVQKLAELQNDEDGGWSGAEGERESQIHVTAIARRSLFAFDRIGYREQIERAEEFIANFQEWTDIREIADVCVTLLETHLVRRGPLIKKLIAMIKEHQQFPLGAFKKTEEPNILTTAIAIRALALFGEGVESESVRKGVEFIHISQHKEQSGWPIDSDRHLPDPWTTTEVLHSLLHVERVVPLSVAFNELLDLTQRIRDEVVLDASYQLENAWKKAEGLEQRIEKLNAQIVNLAEAKDRLDRNNIELQEKLKGLTDRLSHYKETANWYKDQWQEAMDIMRKEKDLSRQREDNLHQRIEQLIQESTEKQMLERELATTKRSNTILRWLVSVLITITLGLLTIIAQIMSARP
jgi:hypothetical protein